MTNAIRIDVSPGELIDKITILEIKAERIDDAGKLVNIRHELDTLQQARAAHIDADDAQVRQLTDELRRINEALWEIEDAIRECESAQDFGARFIDLARSVYRRNDERAAVKRQLNTALGSRLVEEKSYQAY